MAEHMLILGVESPQGEKTYVAAAFPSACGKTNFAMLIPPEQYKGWKITTVGDDIAWMKPGPDGRLYAINPEAGYFGVVPGTNFKSNPNAMLSMSRTPFTPTSRSCPTAMSGGKARTARRPPRPRLEGPSLDARLEGKSRAPEQPLRRADAEQPRARARRPTTRTACRSARSSSAAAARRRCRWSSRPSTGSTASTSARPWAARRPPPPPARSARCAAIRWRCSPSAATTWASISATGCACASCIKRPPKIFHVNWFRKGADGNFLWPGYGENMRVLKWIVDRCRGRVPADETPLGWMPAANDIDIEGLPSYSRGEARAGALDQRRELEARSAPAGRALLQALRRPAQGTALPARTADLAVVAAGR